MAAEARAWSGESRMRCMRMLLTLAHGGSSARLLSQNTTARPVATWVAATLVRKAPSSVAIASFCVVSSALDVPAMDMGGLDLLDRYEARIGAEDPFLQTADDMSFFCHGDGTFVKPDAEGRIQLTDFIRSHTGISSEMAFVGRGHFFQIWQPERFAEHREQVRARLLALRQQAAGGSS